MADNSKVSVKIKVDITTGFGTVKRNYSKTTKVTIPVTQFHLLEKELEKELYSGKAYDIVKTIFFANPTHNHVAYCFKLESIKVITKGGEDE